MDVGKELEDISLFDVRVGGGAEIVCLVIGADVIDTKTIVENSSRRIDGSWLRFCILFIADFEFESGFEKYFFVKLNFGDIPGADLF